MVSVFTGSVLETSAHTIKVKDRLTGKVFEAEPHPDMAFTVNVGDEAIFVGVLQQNGRYQLNRFDVRKFMRPLDEEDLVTASGRDSLIAVIDDPFFRAFSEREEELYWDEAWVKALADPAQAPEIEESDEENVDASLNRGYGEYSEESLLDDEDDSDPVPNNSSKKSPKTVTVKITVDNEHEQEFDL